MIIDILGMCPFNLALGIHYSKLTEKDSWAFGIVLLRLLRIVSVWKMVEIFNDFQSFYKIPELVKNLFKTLIFFTILSHFTTCAWVFLVNVIESDEPDNWINCMGF